MRSVSTRPVAFLVVATALAACGGRAAPASSPPTTSATPAPAAKAAPAADANAVTEERFCALMDRVADKIDASIEAALKKKDLTPDEAVEVLRRIAPEGAKADMAEIVAASGIDPLAVAAFVRDQNEAAKRCADRFAAHVDASLQRATPIVDKAKQAKSAPSL